MYWWIKNSLDFLLSFLGIVILAPLFLIITFLIKIDSRGPVLFLQERVGKNFKPFKIIKFRTMVHDSNNNHRQITISNDDRITKIGKFLRAFKLDELPQLINVLKGDMSFVGPRPEVPKYVTKFQEQYTNLLRVRPGITDPASLNFANESKLLQDSSNWELDYIEKILPEKIRLSQEYVEQCNLITDLKIILQTIFR